MRLPLFQVDAFTDRVFRGNPAAVVPLDDWLPDDLLQSIAFENNLSETAFFVPCDAPPGFSDGPALELRWFTPAVEVALCGHATLASARVVLSRLRPEAGTVRFSTKSGWLTVRSEGDRLSMDFPSQPPLACETPGGLAKALGLEPDDIEHVSSNVDLLVEVPSTEHVRGLRVDMAAVAALPVRGVCVTAAGDDEADFVSRFFAPGVGVPEDPVTGSAHCKLVPYWSARLGRTSFVAHQLSARGGVVWCDLIGDRVQLAGHAVDYLEGTITL